MAHRSVEPAHSERRHGKKSLPLTTLPSCFFRAFGRLTITLSPKQAIGEAAFKAAVRNLVSKVTVYPPKPGEQPDIYIEGYLSNLVNQDLAHRVSVRGERW